MVFDEIEILVRVVIALVLGGLIGIEREFAKRPAGIRTHMFVAGAAALVVTISHNMVEQFSQSSNIISADPTRVIEAVIVGISFIGAGVVLKSTKTHQVYFLTTAASILFTATIGIAVALWHIKLAIVLTCLVILISYVIGEVEEYFIRSREAGEATQKKGSKK